MTNQTKLSKTKGREKKCKHEPEIRQVIDVGKGYVHQYHIVGNVCIKCGKLL